MPLLRATLYLYYSRLGPTFFKISLGSPESCYDRCFDWYETFKVLKRGEVFETELILTPLRVACRGMRLALILVNYRPKFKSTKTW